MWRRQTPVRREVDIQMFLYWLQREHGIQLGTMRGALEGPHPFTMERIETHSHAKERALIVKYVETERAPL